MWTSSWTNTSRTLQNHDRIVDTKHSKSDCNSMSFSFSSYLYVLMSKFCFWQIYAFWNKQNVEMNENLKLCWSTVLSAVGWRAGYDLLRFVFVDHVKKAVALGTWAVASFCNCRKFCSARPQLAYCCLNWYCISTFLEFISIASHLMFVVCLPFLVTKAAAYVWCCLSIVILVVHICVHLPVFL